MDNQSLEVLICEIGAQRIGVPARDVVELLRAVAVTPLPGPFPSVEGMIDLRGRVIPVLDLRRRLALPAKPVAPSDHLIIARVGGSLVALRVDRALELARLEIADLDHSSAAGASAQGPPSRVVKLRDGLAVLHDLASLFSKTDVEGLQDALPALASSGGEGGPGELVSARV